MRKILTIFFGFYMFIYVIFLPYYTWQDIKAHDSFIRYIFISPIIGFYKSIFWPYFILAENDNIEKSQRTPLIIICKNQYIPQFTLDYNSNPTQIEIEKLCECIWFNSSDLEKNTMVKYSKKEKVDSISEKTFPSSFGKILERCGGYTIGK